MFVEQMNILGHLLLDLDKNNAWNLLFFAFAKQ